MNKVRRKAAKGAKTLAMSRSLDQPALRSIILNRLLSVAESSPHRFGAALKVVTPEMEHHSWSIGDLPVPILLHTDDDSTTPPIENDPPKNTNDNHSTRKDMNTGERPSEQNIIFPACPRRRKLSQCPTKLASEHDLILWNLTLDLIRPIPQYALEQSSMRIPSNVSIHELDVRISSFLRNNSMSSQNNECGASTEALSPSNIRFIISLWRGRQTRSGHTIIMEVQRRSGCAMEFHRISEALMSAVRTGQVPMVNNFTSDRNDTIREADISDADALMACSPPVIDAATATLNLLKETQLESQRLGMESLGQLTNPETVCPRNAFHVARLILLGNDELAMELRMALLWSNGVLISTHAECSTEAYDLTSSEHAAGVIRNLGLQVLSNCLELLSANPYMSGQVSRYSELWAGLVPALVNNIRNASEMPNAAALSAECLSHVEWGSSEGRSAALRHDVVQALVQALEYAKGRHMSLEMESHKLITILSSLPDV